jgi:hypothetical protein
MNTHRIHGMTMGMPHCWGFFGSGDKSQSTYNTQTGASEEAQLITGAGSAAAKDEAVVLGGSFNTNKITGTDASGGGMVNSGVSGNRDSTITVGYDAGQFQTALQSVGSNLSNALNAQSAAGASTLDKVLEKVGSLAESKQTDGISGLSKTALWALALVAAVLATWIFKRWK